MICFGALNIDKLYRVNKIAGPGEESSIFGFIETPGGAAANTAVGLSRLGLKAGYIGKLAEDRGGRRLLEEFKKERVNVDGVMISDVGETGIVIGFVDSNGKRALYAIPGANNMLDFDEINLKYASNCSFLHLTAFVGDSPYIAQQKLVNTLSSKCKITFDPGDLYARKGLNSLKPILEKCFLISLTERELRMLTSETYKKGTEMLLNIGAEIVAVKLGPKGCYVTNGDEGHCIKPFGAKVVDTTGAGEAFNTGFLYGLVMREGLLECGKIGNYVASKCISRFGSREGLPYLAQLRNLE